MSRSTKFCHDCMHLGTGGGSPKCALKFKIRYTFPKDSLDLNHGFQSVNGCGRSFTQRTSDYYTDRRTLWNPSPRGLARSKKEKAK